MEKSSSRIKLSVELEAPVLVLPLSATSHAAFILDLGELKLENAFVLASCMESNMSAKNISFVSPSGQPAIVDQLTVSLTSIQLGRSENPVRDERGIFEGGVVDHVIVEPLEFNGLVNRSLSSWYVGVPRVDVKANLQAIEVREGATVAQPIIKKCMEYELAPKSQKLTSLICVFLVP